MHVHDQHAALFIITHRFLPQYRHVMPFVLEGQSATHAHYREIIDEHARHLGDNQGNDGRASGNATRALKAVRSAKAPQLGYRVY